ncbi:F0F1 ATP synthase subunit delta [Sporosarcina pasteurii]|uniref:ATP synthase subunit delta n=1 Tax=Sporosarcina pasteurii TaxID=1474 RepID=A0A380BEW3_SPOPA|nr:F0F1 ATP synthase subunit delta [Sporosarcina pasteurii]MDS9472272.1 F0F1 ATP synthase subunit delta [Sporosarcina pasteurii]QBQ06253.1 F0F1 ATP synthase subunit delta [Sporosarcina pasteurii]SUI99106.1 F-type ATPase subunit delta [Sporosarcina pasteurii]
MSKSIVANRYALALFNTAQEKGKVDKIQQELLEIKEVFQTNQELEELLHNPRLSIAEKKELLAQLFKKANQYVQNTLFLLLEKKRIDDIINFVDEFIKIANDAAGVADAKVYSTRELTKKEVQAISSTFAAKIGKQSLRIENIIDSSLIGGIRLQIGNRIYDSSLSGKLNRLQRDLIRS